MRAFLCRNTQPFTRGIQRLTLLGTDISWNGPIYIVLDEVATKVMAYTEGGKGCWLTLRRERVNLVHEAHRGLAAGKTRDSATKAADTQPQSATQSRLRAKVPAPAA
jgi:hypothetical protein